MSGHVVVIDGDTRHVYPGDDFVDIWLEPGMWRDEPMQDMMDRLQAKYPNKLVIVTRRQV
jgi:non-ribosomal peptide synthetase component E (peptide arylation enzyme)